ncbi:hypothetical protein [Colwellia sp. Bg11-12]|uniref:hypothetical protein n=1 Tax=Colwellia sp. Bg11-12 TaxID=2759817 RepID=UPI0015F765C9|nr:hypothetical protein [Colwellia sp. Bg11-12]MBA6264294.1 hypothetical protein [Colwellia sp. Bg11-12]
MKWMLLCLFFISANTYAAEQFTEAECILLKHHITDYKRRLGVNSPLYQQSNTSAKNHCKTPISTVKKTSPVLTTSLVKNDSSITTNSSALSLVDTKNPNSSIAFNPLDMIIKVFSFSWPIWIVLLLLTILRSPSVKGKLGEL